MKSLILPIVITFTLLTLLSAQEKYGRATPQTADFMISGKYPVSMYTGKLNTTIPIYNIQDPDFSHSVSISYNSDGFKPHKHSGIIGYNWILNAGGCITREVANIPDEHLNQDNDVNFGIHGFLSLSRLKTYNKDYVYNFSSQVGQFVTSGNQTDFRLYNNSNELMENFEYMPDVFSFNFGGKSGQFIIGNDGKIIVISDEWVDVDLTGMTSYQPQLSVYRCLEGNHISTIKITDTEGYQYFFGGSNQAVEFSITVNCQANGGILSNAGYEQATPTINAWHLTQIVAPNGRIMQFQYKTSTGTCYQHTDPLWQYRLNKSTSGGNTTTTMSATKSAVLEKITIPDIDFELNFNLTTQNTRKLYNNSSEFNNQNYRLTSVIGTIDNNERCNIEFEQVNYPDSENWGYQFLKSVIFSPNHNPHKYQFSYNTENLTFPNPILLVPENTDEFGYWKNNNFLGLINSVTYPTGAKSNFVYEKHDYGTKRYYEYANNNGVATIEPKVAYTVPMESGGVRLKSITNYLNENDSTDKVIYNYSSKFDLETSLATYNEFLTPTPNRNDFGCLQNEIDNQIDVVLSRCRNSPGYQESGIHSTGVYNSSHIAIPFYPNLIRGIESDLYNIGEPHIGYREVTEIAIDFVTGKKTYKTNTFTDYLTNPDVKASNYSNSIDLKVLYLYQHTNSSLSLHRGKLLSETWRTNSKEIAYQSKNFYKLAYGGGDDELILDYDNRLANTQYLVTMRNTGNFAITKKIYYTPSPVVSKQTTEFAGNSEIVNLSNFSYDDKFRIIESTRLLSNGKYEFIQYKYPDQLTTHISSAPSNTELKGFYYLSKKNLISKPVEVIQGTINNNFRTYNSSLITIYNTITTANDTIAAPAQQLMLRIDSPIDNYTSLSVNNGQLVKDSRLALTKEFEFSNKLRLTKYTNIGELPIIYTWDSKLMYPNQESQGNQTIIYNYLPMVGMSEKKDARGISVYYYYDHLGRLTEIRDDYGKLIQFFEYNYKIINP